MGSLVGAILILFVNAPARAQMNVNQLQVMSEDSQKQKIEQLWTDFLNFRDATVEQERRLETMNWMALNSRNEEIPLAVLNHYQGACRARGAKEYSPCVNPAAGDSVKQMQIVHMLYDIGAHSAARPVLWDKVVAVLVGTMHLNRTSDENDRTYRVARLAVADLADLYRIRPDAAIRDALVQENRELNFAKRDPLIKDSVKSAVERILNRGAAALDNPK